MVLNLLYLLTILMVVNFVVGFLRGIWAEGFNKDKFLKGFTTYLLIWIGFAALDLFAYKAGEAISGFTYLAGILIDPIARYLVKILDTLRELLDFVFGKKAPKEEIKTTIVSTAATPAQTVTVAADGTVQVKRKRGRPRKYPLPEETAAIKAAQEAANAVFNASQAAQKADADSQAQESEAASEE